MEEAGAKLDEDSLTELFSSAQPKLTDIDGQTSLVSSKTLTTPGLMKPAQGKYLRLRRELSMAMRAGYNETVCVVTVVDETTDCSERDHLEHANVSHSDCLSAAYMRSSQRTRMGVMGQTLWTYPRL